MTQRPCIDRKVMPQVDIADLPGLLRHLWEKHRIGHVLQKVHPSVLTVRQCPDAIRQCSRTELLLKPLLVSQDMYILDGNHRWARMVESCWTEARCYVLAAPFDRAKWAIGTYPEAYTYADGNIHPERW